MADTYTSNLRVRLPETGQYGNSWGTVLNSDAIELLDQAVAGQAAIAIGTDTTYTLPALTDGSASNSRRFALKFSGTPASAVTVTVPASVTKKFYLIENATGQTITIKYNASTGVEISNGSKQLVWCDGTEIYRVTADAVNATQLGGVAAANYARLDNPQSFTKGQRYPFVTLTDAATITPNCDNGNNFYLVLGGNRTLANPSNATDGQTIQVLVKQDGTGNRTLAYGSKFRWADGLTPTLTSTSNRADLIVATYHASLDIWIATVILNFVVT